MTGCRRRYCEDNSERKRIYRNVYDWGKRIGKNEEAVKGKLSGAKLEEAFISHPIHPVTFELDWSRGRATINDDGNLIVISSFIEFQSYHYTVVLKRKK